MKRLYRTLITLIAIIILMLTNLGSSIANQAYAWELWTNQPQWNEPSFEDPPEWDAPSWETPPEWTQPEWTTPPEWRAPSLEAPPEWNYVPWKTPPTWNLNPQNPNNGNNPGQIGPDGNLITPSIVPDGSSGTNPGPPYNPDYQNPAQETFDQLNQTVKQPVNEAPFFNVEEAKPYDSIKFVAKDVMGGTVEFAIETVKTGNATLPGYLGNRGNIALSGFKTFAKGDPTLDAVYDGADVVSNLIGMRENYNDFTALREVQRLRDAGDIITSAEKLEELARAGRTFTPANAVLSAATLPFAIKDTVDNVGKFNAAKTSEEKTNAGWDLAGNAGEIMTGLAPIVAITSVIPGAQPIAAGLLVVGGALTLASAGHKIWRNREKIMKDVGQKFNQAKDAVTGFFKSVFG